MTWVKATRVGDPRRLAAQPWKLFNVNGSPFMDMFAPAGVVGATGVVNFVVLTSATSSANSGIYSTSCVFLLAGVVLLYAEGSVAVASPW